ncbi:MerR family transcriptional regulator [Cellulophaga fucicola]|uniref:DNA-binding transcriptional regulator, MerR family n=1 Tax=Cellulophaga fucicola TaxID=76595 RepID=A0A1K1R501_9FLAO|nr:MerR family transcriptional regulator [Cellulophaga fucicola]SFW66996.1 DNA-binding transcriptional regulator, MerR family [Cellulophaga fucicola]
MGSYSMSQVATLTGINAHTLRKWESRYSFIEPERTDTNIRFYTDELLRKLLNVSILQRNGFKISKIDKMSNEELHSNVTEVLLKPIEGDELTALMLGLLEMNEREFIKIIDAQILSKGLLNAIKDLIYPFLNQIGVLWGIDKVMPAQEHFISNLIRQKVIAAINALPLPDKNAPKIILFLPENEHHEIGLLLAQYIAKDLGWNVFYLGQHVPISNIESVQSIVKPNLLLTMFVTTVPDRIKEKIEAILSQTTVDLLVSGNPVNLETKYFEDRTIYVSNPGELIDILRDRIS